MEGYAQEKEADSFTAEDSYYTTPLWDGIRCELELTSGVRDHRTGCQGCSDPQDGVFAA
jgi:hypothetical protein